MTSQTTENTDIELLAGDGYRVFYIKGQASLGIDVGGHVIVQPVREWFAKSKTPPLLPLGAAGDKPAPVAAEAWQPIETAPQDGYMLVHEDDAIRALLRIKGVWHKPGYPAIVSAVYPDDAIVGDDAKRMLPAGLRLELRDGCCENPTHWMPLPEAPLAPSGSGSIR